MAKENVKVGERIVATDCGSTTTKAILIEERDGVYRLVVRGEAPTTVEKPAEDVTMGVLNAVGEVEDLTGLTLIRDGKLLSDGREDQLGMDNYMSTSSAGGGLQMMVAGVVKSMTAESAQRAALGAGAIVMDTIASNDGRFTHEKIEVIRHLRPDMILLSGGIDGGTVSHVVELAEIISAADPRPRFGVGYKLPVIYAGNVDARGAVGEALSDKTSLEMVDNLRPVLERENLGPARDKIHDLFMEHVMAQAPGYKKLMSWTKVPIMPTPGAVGYLINEYARDEDKNVLGVDIGGATTDIFSVFSETFNRTVSANLGMSYSISNVVAEAGFKRVTRWLPFKIDEKEIRNRIRNKMIRPTTIPQTLVELKMEQAIAREALRLALIQHKSLAVGLKGVQQQRTISDAFDQKMSGETLVDMMKLDMIIGSGGVLSHAPRRAQAAMIMIDGFRPEGVTRLSVDSIFMMPQLGVLASINKKAANEVFDRDCLIHLGTCICPSGERKEGKSALKIKGETSSGKKIDNEYKYGQMGIIELGMDETANVTLYPSRGLDVGEGPGNEVELKLYGGVVGVIVDCRGRPLTLPEDMSKRRKKLEEWNKTLGIYSE